MRIIAAAKQFKFDPIDETWIVQCIMDVLGLEFYHLTDKENSSSFLCVHH